MSTKDKIMDAAEGYIRTRGFNSFSFRDIANNIGIKSASVHYHFPTKDDLGEAVTHRYSERIADILGDPVAKDVPAPEKLARFTAIYRGTLLDHQKMCLCGMLGAEIESLGESVKTAVTQFFDMQENWLTDVLKNSCAIDVVAARSRARSSIAALQGAVLMTRTSGNIRVFDDIAAQVTKDIGL